MNTLEFINQYIVLVGIVVGGLIYLIRSWKQTGGTVATSTIQLLQAEVGALKERLTTTTTQLTQLNGQIIDLTTKVTKLRDENVYLTDLINAALKDYFRESDLDREHVRKRLKKSDSDQKEV